MCICMCICICICICVRKLVCALISTAFSASATATALSSAAVTSTCCVACVWLTRMLRAVRAVRSHPLTPQRSQRRSGRHWPSSASPRRKTCCVHWRMICWLVRGRSERSRCAPCCMGGNRTCSTIKQTWIYIRVWLDLLVYVICVYEYYLFIFQFNVYKSDDWSK